jgi:DNA helicase-2/ATP-dependent DNA helicase PcrA
MNAKVWSPYQNDIFQYISTGTGNAIVKAVAGSGKSTTIVECTKRIPTGKSSILLAFNKAIAEDLKSKGVNAKTFHALTYGPVMRSRNTQTVEANKLKMLCKEMMGATDCFIYSNFCCRLVGLARNAGIGVLTQDIEQEWWALIDHHNLELDNENGNIQEAVEHSRELLGWSNESNFVDFDDMLYFAVRDNVALQKYDYVFVDEAQDTNAIQRALVRKIMHENTRVVFVGDPKQSIYGFRGADSESMDLLAKEFECKQLPLTISYRCATSIVQAAKKYVDHIEAASGAPEGRVYREANLAEAVEGTARLVAGTSTEATPNEPEDRAFTPRDLVVCRTTKPLVSLAFRLMRKKVPVKILGREIGQGLKALVGKMRANNVDELIVKLEAWTVREVDKAIAKQLDNKVEQLQDKCDTILCLIEGLHEDERTVLNLVAAIDNLFNERNDALTLCSIHKAKGLEAERVWWLNSSSCPSKWAKQEWQKNQELNLCYVAITRAKTSLLFIEDDSGKKQTTLNTAEFRTLVGSVAATEEVDNRVTI